MYSAAEEGKDKQAMMEEGNSVQSTDTSPGHSSSDADYAARKHHALGRGNTRYEPEGITTSNKRFIVVADFQAQDETDMSVKRGEVLQIVATREDGWWLAENKRGVRGFVPKTFLKVDKQYKRAIKCKKHVTIPNPTATEQTKEASGSQLSKNSEEVKRNEQEAMQLLDAEGQEDKGKVTATAKIITSGRKLSGSKRENNETEIEEGSKFKDGGDSERSEQNFAIRAVETACESPVADNYQAINTIATSNCYERTVNYVNHQTYQCYLAPRLSESNLAYHDIYWNYADDRLRKRRVRVSKLIKMGRLEKAYLDVSDVHCRLLRVYLLDLNASQDERQIVSNVHTIKANPRSRDPSTWIFSMTSDTQKATALNHGRFIVRSNYKQKSVVLCLEASVICAQEGEVKEESLGCATVQIINENGQCCIRNRNYCMKLTTRDTIGKKGTVAVSNQIQINFQVCNVPDRSIHQVDSLPDIILCNELFVPMFFYYRRLLGQFLSKNFDNGNSAALKAEPFLGTFAAVADQPDLMETLRKLWQIHFKAFPGKFMESEEAELFRSFFLTTAFILHSTILMPAFDWSDARGIADRQAVLSNFQEHYLHDYNAFKYLSKQRCRPVNVFSCGLDTVGPHAID